MKWPSPTKQEQPVRGTSLRSPRFANGTRSLVDQCLEMSPDPWTSGVLPRKDVELISLAVNAACTELERRGNPRHIRGALEAGATREEILMVLKIGSLLSLHTCSLGAPILLEEAKAAGVKLAPKGPAATPVCDKMKAAGQWNTAWDAFLRDRPGLDGSDHRREPSGLHQRSIHAQTGGAPEHRRRCVDHSHVRARNTPAHPVGAEARRDHGGDHGSTQDLCLPGDAGEQSRYPHPGRGTSTRSGRWGSTWLNSLKPRASTGRAGETTATDMNGAASRFPDTGR